MTDGGLEETAAVHVVGPYLLTCLLEPLLRRAAPARVVWVSSGGMYTRQLDVERLDQPSTPYRGTTVYATAKRAQVALARQWDQRWPRAGVSSYAMHPGRVDTDELRTGLPVFAAVLGPILRRAEQEAHTAVWLADGGADANAPATFWLDRRAVPTIGGRVPLTRPASPHGSGRGAGNEPGWTSRSEVTGERGGDRGRRGRAELCLLASADPPGHAVRSRRPVGRPRQHRPGGAGRRGLRRRHRVHRVQRAQLSNVRDSSTSWAWPRSRRR